MLEELFDTSSEKVEKDEATFYKGDNQSLHAHLGVRHIKQLKQIFSLICYPDSRKSLESKLEGIDRNIKLQFEMKNPFKIFIDCVLLKLDTLTPHQKDALQKMKDLNLKWILLDGRAGAGKT